MDSNAEAGPSKSPSPAPSRAPNFRLTQSLYGHTRGVTAVEWSKDGRYLVSGGADGLLNIYGIPPENSSSTSSPSTSISGSLSHLKTIKAHTSQLGGVNSISISPDSLYVATAGDDNISHIFYLSPTSFSPSDPLSSGQTSRSSLVSLNGTDGTNGELAEDTPSMVLNGKKPIRTFIGHTAPILSVAFSPKSNLLVTGSYDESAIVWDVRTGVILRQLPAHSEAVWTVGWDGEGVMVLTGSADGLIRLWDATSGQCLKTLDNDSNSPVTSALFTPNPFYLISGTSGTIRVYNIHTGKVVKTLRAPGLFNEGKNPVSVGYMTALPLTSHDSLHRDDASTEMKKKGDEDDRMDVDVDVGDAQNTDKNDVDGNKGVNGEISRSSHRGSGKQEKKEAWIVTGGDNGKIVIWELGSKKVVQVLDNHKSGVVCLSIHPDGKGFSTGSLEPEKVVHIWRDDG